MRRAAFIDRDGTIARDVPYCRRPEDFEILPLVPQAIRLFNENGFKVVVITNQSGLARGYFTENTLDLIHQKMLSELAAQGACIDAIYFCPHHPDEGCPCRKPKPALLLQAAEHLGIELSLSYMIGDDEKDVGAGRSAGCRTVWLTDADAKQSSAAVVPDHISRHLYEAAQWVICDASSRRSPPPKVPRGISDVGG